MCALRLCADVCALILDALTNHLANVDFPDVSSVTAPDDESALCCLLFISSSCQPGVVLCFFEAIGSRRLFRTRCLYFFIKQLEARIATLFEVRSG